MAKALKKTIDQSIGTAVGTAEKVAGAAGRLGKSVFESGLRLPGLRRSAGPGRRPAPGAPPGIEHLPEINEPPAPGAVTIRCIEYGPDRVADAAVDDLDAFLAAPRASGLSVRWINVDGLNPYVINRFRQRFSFHPLAAEDVLHVPQRPKVEPYDDCLYIVTRMLRLVDGQLVSEQISIFLYADTIITFQETRGDVWDPIRARILTAGSRVRTGDIGYLLYALLDALVDHFFPILEQYGDQVEGLEDRVLREPTPALLQQIHTIKRDLGLLRRVIWPQRELVDGLCRTESTLTSAVARTYFRDIHDHAIQIIDIIETYREMASSLTDLYMSAVSNRMNETMKVLTIMASFFIPITFFAGVYGMNFEYMPELGLRYAYPIFWLVCLAITGTLWLFFRRRGWLGGHD